MEKICDVHAEVKHVEISDQTGIFCLLDVYILKTTVINKVCGDPQWTYDWRFLYH